MARAMHDYKKRDREIIEKEMLKKGKKKTQWVTLHRIGTCDR